MENTSTRPRASDDPPADYSPDMTAHDIDATYRRLFDEAVEAHAGGDPFALADDIRHELQAGNRLAHARRVAIRDGHHRAPDERGVRRTTTGVELPDDGSMECDTCEDELPARKFPTISGKPGLRGTTCRACKKGNRR